jgi:hypothetical protein
MQAPFIPRDFQVPVRIDAGRMLLRPLTVKDVLKDYDAVMTSIDHLQGVFGDPRWPSPDLSLEQEIIDLAWHQKEFQRRSSFTYTVMTPDEKRCIGCVYIVPARVTDADAEVYLWVRKDELANGTDADLYSFVKTWIAREWPFNTVAFPGRDGTPLG